jgi:hypothetical protein
MNIKQIVQKYLTDNGYDGLVEPNTGCGCGIDNFCQWWCEDCTPAYKHESEMGDEVYCTTKEIKKTKDGHCIGCVFHCDV